ncbi:MAG TPA: PAS domain S-box protein [Opitutaceae bacterium]|nr:PAS domain S-box protein [Opitutaceae bacterium]
MSGSSLHAIAAQAPAILFSKNLEGRYTSVNPAFESLVALPHGKILGQRDADLFPAEQAAVLANNDASVIASGVPQTFEEHVAGVDGPHTWLVCKFPLRTEAGALSGIGGIATDITSAVAQRKRLEEEARLIAQRFKLATEAACIGIWDWDLKKDRWYASPTYFTMLGYRPEEGFANRDVWIERLHPADHDEVVRKIREVLDGHAAVVQYEARIRHADGSYRWVGVVGRVLSRDEHGKPSRMLGSRIDITERRQAAEAAHTSERRFRALIEKSTDVVALIDATGMILYDSPSVATVLGYAPGELVGRPAMSLVHPEDVPRMTDTMQRLLQAPLSSEKVSFRLQHKNGAFRWIEGTGTNLLDEPGVNAIVINYRDISERRQLEEQLRQSQKLESIGQLAGGVAHDFNNLLTVITGHLSLIKLRGNVAPDVSDSLREIGAASDRAANLTRQLLAFSRRQVMQLRDLDVNEIVENMAKMLRRLVGEDVALHFRPAAQSLVIHADPGMVEQILLNLAVNARDAMPEGGHLTIATTPVEIDTMAARPPQSRPGRFACLTVVDSGVGIAAEVLPHIFEPFFTTKDVGQGSGLGLATVYGIVQQHEGWLEVSSRVNEGTTFRIYLPRRGDALPAPAAEAPRPAVAGGRETILLVEDEPAVRAIMSVVLMRHGYVVLEAENGRAAQEVWARHRERISLLLTDLVMPDGVSGQELARLLARDKPKLRVIFTSGYSAAIAGRDFPLKEGVNFLAKPFEASRLAQVVRATLDATESKAPFAPLEINPGES